MPWNMMEDLNGLILTLNDCHSKEADLMRRVWADLETKLRSRGFAGLKIVCPLQWVRWSPGCCWARRQETLPGQPCPGSAVPTGWAKHTQCHCTAPASSPQTRTSLMPKWQIVQGLGLYTLAQMKMFPYQRSFRSGHSLGLFCPSNNMNSKINLDELC